MHEIRDVRNKKVGGENETELKLLNYVDGPICSLVLRFIHFDCDLGDIRKSIKVYKTKQSGRR